MTAVAYILAILAVGAALGLAIGVLCGDDIRVLCGRIARRFRRLRSVRKLRRLPPLQKHTGHHRAGAAPVVPLPPARVIAQDGAMPRSQRWYPYTPLTEQVIPRKQVEGHAPWTGEMPRLTDADMDRVRIIRAQLAESARHGQLTPEEEREAVRVAVATLRQPVYGEASVAGVLAAEEQRAEAMLP